MSNKVALIIVSHSIHIGEGVKELISQVITDVPVMLACGTSDNEIGTSIEKIQAAMKSVNGKSEAILFYDLGSAKMNAEMAIEMYSIKNTEIAEGIPIVEGAYVAAVESNMGKAKSDILKSLQKLKADES
ncbi:dihydroxyacetone kinase phosphoryl donor subunit DhaM [Gracilibacillus ureilyticus]|uniref:dihydroxyacetone kinase phosphoryl donor subunit DhaM n=1 Tax=Gracilibacillus ureilyticus TaxID=531814 RepID=UPI001FDF05A3|nr:dihydroxyacetone kinase phosphoryl donor subunit DhaM [Gracilibacillus ureilyticus]